MMKIASLAVCLVLMDAAVEAIFFRQNSLQRTVCSRVNLGQNTFTRCVRCSIAPNNANSDVLSCVLSTYTSLGLMRVCITNSTTTAISTVGSCRFCDSSTLMFCVAATSLPATVTAQQATCLLSECSLTITSYLIEPISFISQKTSVFFSFFRLFGRGKRSENEAEQVIEKLRPVVKAECVRKDHKTGKFEKTLQLDIAKMNTVKTLLQHSTTETGDF